MSDFQVDTSISIPSHTGKLDLAGKKVLIVGGTDGIGRALAQLITSLHASVTIVGRTNRDPSNTSIKFVKADLSLMKNAKECGEQLETDFDVIIFTNGILTTSERIVSADGIEIDLAVSAFSRQVMLKALAPRLTKEVIRVFIMGFPGNKAMMTQADLDDLNAEKSYESWPHHMRTVVVNEAFALSSGARWGNSKMNLFGLHPGLISTNIRKPVLGCCFSFIESCIGCCNISTEDYANNLVPVLFNPTLANHHNLHFNNKGQVILKTVGMTEAYVEQVLQKCEELVNSKSKF